MKLWKEFAIEPSIFANYHLGTEILGGLGFEHGRVVGALPKKWSHLVRKCALANSEMQYARLVERLGELKQAMWPRDHAYDGTRQWRDQAFECHQVLPFDGILLEGPSSVQGSIDTTFGMAGQQAWAHERRVKIPRIAAKLGQVLKPLLWFAHEVIIVDRHFNPSLVLGQSKWLRPLQALAAQLPIDGRITRFEVHALSVRHEPWPARVFVQHCRNNLPSALPRGIRLDAMLWKERNDGVQFHERLIVTDLGGVVIDPGIDDGSPGQVYDLRLLSKQEVPHYLEKFAKATAPYDLVEQQRVTGT